MKLEQIIVKGGIYRRRDGSTTKPLVDDLVLRARFFVCDQDATEHGLVHIVGETLPSMVLGDEYPHDLVERIG